LLVSMTSLLIRLPARRRLLTHIVGASGIIVCLFLAASPNILPGEVSRYMRIWLPAGLILVAYHQSGLLFDKPWARFQNWLKEWDRRLLGRIGREPGVVPLGPVWQLYMETCYLLCYPLIPAALGALILLNHKDKVEEFWTIVLSSAYICYAFVPILPALPPRLLLSDGTNKGTSSKSRALNEWILRHGSIRANTFPSAHVASCTAASIALARYDILYGSVFLWLSLSIAAAVVVRRYHYLADAVLGLILPIFLYLLIR